MLLLRTFDQFQNFERIQVRFWFIISGGIRCGFHIFSIKLTKLLADFVRNKCEMMRENRKYQRRNATKALFAVFFENILSNGLSAKMNHRKLVCII